MGIKKNISESLEQIGEVLIFGIPEGLVYAFSELLNMLFSEESLKEAYHKNKIIKAFVDTF